MRVREKRTKGERKRDGGVSVRRELIGERVRENREGKDWWIEREKRAETCPMSKCVVLHGRSCQVAHMAFSVTL